MYMERCLELAKNGLGTTYPNPLVGSVIVHDNKIIGEGWHFKAGEAHAEVNAINSVKNKALLSKSTLYVNLEPCSHFGKTPPCANLITDSKIKNVVIGSLDTNSAVNGKGVSHLQQHGCNVTVGVLEAECKALNKRFFTFHQKQRPYIILKWAETIDGFIAPLHKERIKVAPVWISNSKSLQLVHQWRAEEQAIFVGTNTVLSDNPKLNTRNFLGNSPIRVVIDNAFRIPKNSNVLDGTQLTIVFTSQDVKQIKNVIFVQIDFQKNIIPQICNELYGRNIQSIIIEGGAHTLQQFIDSDLWDEARIFIGEINFKTGIQAPNIKGKLVKKQQIQDNELRILSHD